MARMRRTKVLLIHRAQPERTTKRTMALTKRGT
jgi:hypothetical protein